MPEDARGASRPCQVLGIDAACVRLRCTRAASVREALASLGLSRRAVADVLVTGRLRVAGDAVRGERGLGEGDVATLELAAPQASRSSSERLHAGRDVPRADVVWHDRICLAAEKPAGILVHGDGTGAVTLTDCVQASVADIAAREGWPYVPRPQALMRLDVETTGLVLFSLTQEFQPAFDALVAGHDLRKCYLAIAAGTRRRWPDEVVAPIARDRHDARRMRVGRGGKEAVTRVKVLDERSGSTLLALRLLTGRRHQIRVHLAHLGTPVAGDALYGDGRGPLMLHAAALSLTHPVTGEPLRVETDWPGRFTRLFAPRVVDWSIL